VIPPASLSIRIEFAGGDRLGPGKIALLENIREHGSISAAARAMDMSYRRAWLLVENLNALFGEPTVQTRIGRAEGGGAVLTPFGERVVALYRAVERQAATAARVSLTELARARPKDPPPAAPALARRRARGA
jgi:molybdate transport system regulatory protein